MPTYLFPANCLVGLSLSPNLWLFPEQLVDALLVVQRVSPLLGCQRPWRAVVAGLSVVDQAVVVERRVAQMSTPGVLLMRAEPV